MARGFHLMLTNTKALFISVLKASSADLVCDVGSRDGAQSLLFRHLLPDAAVTAFEANPINFEHMQRSPMLAGQRIEMHPFAITNSNGVAKFHVVDVDYSDPNDNHGTSSLLVHDGLQILKSVEVETKRLDDFVLSRFPEAGTVGLWIDVEGVEYGVLDGISKIKERVVAAHVETAKTPMRHGQRTFPEVAALMESYGFVLVGSNITPESNWGDVVFVTRKFIHEHPFRYRVCRIKGLLSAIARVDHIAVFLKAHCRPAYKILRRLYIWLWP
jgi:FkbM family methyltransferase